MIWFILGLVGFVVYFIWFIVEEWEWSDSSDRVFIPFLSFLSALLVSVLCCFISSLVVSEVAELDYTKTNDTEIIALKDNQNISGGFFIMSGYVDEDLYYYYAKETVYGYKTEKVKAENSYIKYTNDKPHIETYEPKFKSGVADAFAICMSDNRYVIYCPENTIANEYVVDLE